MAVSRSTSIVVFVFLFVLMVLIVLDIAMIVSLIRTGDERRRLIVWKASTGTLLIVVGTLVIDVIKAIINAEAMEVNPFIKLSTTAIVYFLELLYFKKRYGD